MKLLLLVVGVLLLVGAVLLGGWLGGLLFTPVGQLLLWEFLMFGLASAVFLVILVGGAILLLLGLFK